MIAIRKSNGALRANAGTEVQHVNDSANILAMHRWDLNGNEIVIVAGLNNNDMTGYELGFPHSGTWFEIFNSQAATYGGNGTGNGGSIEATYTDTAKDGFNNHAYINVPRMSILVFRYGQAPPVGDTVEIFPDPAVAGQNLTIAYNPTGRPLDGAQQVFVHCGFNDWATVIDPAPEMSWNGSAWEVSVSVPADTTQVDIVFHNGSGVWDNNDGSDWHFPAEGGQSGGAVTITPNPAQAGQDATITYDPAGRILHDATQVYIHYGFDGWDPTIDPDVAMTWNAGDSVWEVTVPVLDDTSQIDMVFNDGDATWDNNATHDWHFNVEIPPSDEPVDIQPDPAVAGQNVLIRYNPADRPLDGVAQVYAHVGFNGWDPTIQPDPAMSWNSGVSMWEVTVAVPATASALNVVFTDGDELWDNNNSHDWNFTVTGGAPVGLVVVEPDPVQAGQQATVSYNPAGRPLEDATEVFLHAGFNIWAVMIEPDVSMTEFGGIWRATINVPTHAWQLDLVFNDGAETWDNNGQEDWHYDVEGTIPVTTVYVDPALPTAGQQVTVHYNPSGRPLLGSQSVFLHYGINGWTEVIDPDPVMTWDAALSAWKVTVTLPANATQLDVAFHNAEDTWDTNDGEDWHFTVTTGPSDEWVMNGALDGDAVEIATNNGMVLYAGLKENDLYVATWDAGEGNDHFIYLADTPGGMVAAPWAKSGQVAQWSAFLAQENDDGWNGWFDAEGTNVSTGGLGGGYLEGTINLAEEFGDLPNTIYLAVAIYGNDDEGEMLWDYQVPASVNDDINLDATEYIAVNLCQLSGEATSPADLDGDCQVDLDDYALWRNCLAGPGETPSCGGIDADLDDDGDVDLADYAFFQQHFDP